MEEDAPRDLSGVMDRLEKETEGAETVRVEDVFAAFSGRLFGPLLVLPGLVLLTPLGGIPLVPAGVGVLAAVVSAQRLAGMRRPWVPRRLRERGVERERVVRAFGKARPWTRRVDRVLRPRLTMLTEGRAEIGAAVLALALGASVPIVGLVPLAAALPGAALVLIGLALIARDGLLMLGAWVLSVGAGYVMVAALT